MLRQIHTMSNPIRPRFALPAMRWNDARGARRRTHRGRRAIAGSATDAVGTHSLTDTSRRARARPAACANTSRCISAARSPK